MNSDEDDEDVAVIAAPAPAGNEERNPKSSSCNNDDNSNQGVTVEDEYEYLFGFGSIMNTTTHAPWLKPSNKKKSKNGINENSKSAQGTSSLPGVVAILKKGFGYERQWNFRSSTGFTALGVRKAENPRHQQQCGSDINGVLFRVTKELMPDFDRREVGYEKVLIPLEYLDFDHGDATSESADMWHMQLSPEDRLWLYVPLESHCKPADENHPLLQSYVDTVMQGCLEWGGEMMAETFINTTGGWSTYFLNDTPSSRRPWLYRKDYTTIDRLLQKYADKTHFGDRKHPEEFSSAFHRRMKGTWSIPRRNKNFTGREKELQDLRSRFAGNGDNKSSNSSAGISGASTVVKVEVAGMGGAYYSMSEASRVVGVFFLLNYPLFSAFVCFDFIPIIKAWAKHSSLQNIVIDITQVSMDWLFGSMQNRLSHLLQIIGSC
jgi:hypothetical protein